MSCSPSLLRGSRRLSAAATHHPMAAPDVFHRRSSTSKQRYAYGYAPNNPVSCDVSIRSDVSRPRASVWANPQPSPLPTTMPSGRKKATFARIWKTALAPPSRTSATNPMGSSWGATPKVTPAPRSPDGSGYSVKHTSDSRYSTVR